MTEPQIVKTTREGMAYKVAPPQPRTWDDTVVTVSAPEGSPEPAVTMTLRQMYDFVTQLSHQEIGEGFVVTAQGLTSAGFPKETK